MKIGAFAKHFRINKTTVRYYTDIKLLLPDLTGTYPDYNKACLNDMKDIINYKKMGFTIEEINEVKVLERFYVNLSESNTKHLHDLLDDKIKSHQNTIDSYTDQIQLIETFKQSIDAQEILQSFGLPLTAIKFLSCPKCHSPFGIENATIQDNSIYEGNLICNCGTTFYINKGIIIPKDYKAQLAGRNKQVESIEFLNKLNNNHISLINHVGTKLINKLNQKDHTKGIIFANADIDILMMNLDQTFQPNGYYFLCSYDLSAIKILKSKMERQQIKGNFVFILFQESVPLDHKIPYLIDNVGNLYDCVTKQELGFGIKMFKEHAKYAEDWFLIQLYSPNNSASTVLEPYIHYLNKSNYRDIYEEMGLVFNAKEDIGEFEFIEGMIEHIKDVKSFRMEIIEYKKS
jgi:DNA-binding transcriptional MerR regulator